MLLDLFHVLRIANIILSQTEEYWVFIYSFYSVKLVILSMNPILKKLKSFSEKSLEVL